MCECVRVSGEGVDVTYIRTGSVATAKMSNSDSEESVSESHVGTSTSVK